MRTRIAASIALIALTALLTACASAAEVDERLSITARDAAREARTAALTVAPEATLWWIEGEDTNADGLVRSDSGLWRVVFEVPGKAEQVIVTVTPRALERETGPRRPPPIADHAGTTPGTEWIDSPAALAVVAAMTELPDTGLSMTLIPAPGPQWVVQVPDDGAREWRIDARTGEVLPS